MPKSAVRYDFRRALLDTCINEFELCFMRENEQISRYQMKTDEKHKNVTFFQINIVWPFSHKFIPSK